MDPITAAGLGLSVAQLSMQVFSGCIKGYEMFIDIKDMPIEYERLRVRLRIEQSRFLLWGEKVGLVEEILEQPSGLLQWNRSLVIDILYDIQRAFASCFAVTAKYDASVLPSSQSYRTAATATAQLSTRPKVLQKVLAAFEKGGRAVGRVQWAMLKKDAFEQLIDRLIQFNEKVESLLDRAALDEVREMQAQSNMMLLQLTSKIDELKTLVDAVRIEPSANDREIANISRASTLVAPSEESSNRSLESLALFKAHYIRIEMEISTTPSLLIDFDDIKCDGGPKYTGRQMALLNGRRVWLEWRETADEFLKQPQFLHQIGERVQKLAAILSAADKPAAFRSPKCIGYTKAQQDSKPRYALVNEGPDEDGGDGKKPVASFVSLREMLTSGYRAPALNTRVELARMLVASVLYVHAVNWVHKDIRSENVLFVRGADRKLRLSKPIFAGFEFARPALPDEITVTHTYPVEAVIYRHPDLINGSATRSTKSHDIYSLGLVMAEIALWEPVEEAAKVELRQTGAMQVQSHMLGKQYGIPYALAERAGYAFSDAVLCCVDGSLSPSADEDEESPKTGAEMARRLHEDVLRPLKSIKI